MRRRALKVGDRVRMADMSSYYAYWRVACPGFYWSFKKLKASNPTGVVTGFKPIGGARSLGIRVRPNVLVKMDNVIGKYRGAMEFDPDYWEVIPPLVKQGRARLVRGWRVKARACQYRVFDSGKGDGTGLDRDHLGNPICVRGIAGHRCTFNLCHDPGVKGGPR